MIRVYCPDLRGGNVELPSEEAHHAITVLRAKIGAHVALFDGQGREAAGSIAGIAKRKVVVEVGEVHTREFDCAYRLTIGIALGKAHRQSYVVEKCTELGVAAIWPMITERSVTKPSEAAVEKWSRRAIEAAKQSGRASSPPSPRHKPSPPSSLALPNSTRTIADTLNPSHDREVEDSPRQGAESSPSSLPRGVHPPRRVASSLTPFLTLLGRQPLGASILCLIGPEGGWSDPEREAALAANLTCVTLAPTILRTETAAVTACAGAALLSRTVGA